MNDIQTTANPSMSSLVTGIISDVEELVKQQLTLFRSEVEKDVRKTKAAAIPLGLGVWCVLLGIAALCQMLVYLLQGATAIPLWGCYGLVGLVSAVVGGILTYVGMTKLESFNPLREESANALKENVQCLMNPK
jgi:uncharacterized membrane protein YqjE